MTQESPRALFEAMKAHVDRLPLEEDVDLVKTRGTARARSDGRSTSV